MTNDAMRRFLFPTGILFLALSCGGNDVPEAAAAGGGVTVADDGAKPRTLVFQRVTEPNEKAFTVLVPQGFTTEGGVFHVNPVEAGGPGNATGPKCEFKIKRDAAGTVQLHYLPDVNYAWGPNVRAMFPRGANYQGMTVVPLMSAADFLDEAFRQGRADATDVRVVSCTQLTDIIEACNKVAAPLNRQFAAMGLAPVRFDAAKLVVDYTQDGVDFREEVATILVDMTASATQWNNTRTYALRAPRAQFDAWRRILAISHNSVKVESKWLARALKAQDERSRKVVETMQQIARVDAEIAAHRAKTHADIQHENYLMLTGQEEYINPYTGEVERDTNEYKHRWTDLHGNVVLTDDEDLDPNQLTHNKDDYRRTKVRPRPFR
jgi:hypothetical protein